MGLLRASYKNDNLFIPNLFKLTCSTIFEADMIPTKRTAIQVSFKNIPPGQSKSKFYGDIDF